MRRVPSSLRRMHNACRTYWVNFQRRREPLVVSFPKSGRTWLRLMLEEANIPARYDHAGSDHTKMRVKEELTIAMAPSATKRVLLVRDPRDTVVSGYYQAAKRVKVYSGSMSDFIRDARHGIEKIVYFNLMWVENLRDDPSALILSYESLMQNTELELQKVSAFFGYDLGIEFLRQVVSNNRFSAMQERERQGEFSAFGRAVTPVNPNDISTYKVRRGRVGGYVDELSSEDIAFCEDALEKASYFDIVGS